MFIIKFNNMIRNKWIWGIFATIVVLAFTASDISCVTPEGELGTYGSLEGEAVSPREYETARATVAFEMERQGAQFDQVEREIWRRLAALRYAKKLGLTVEDETLARVIQNDPSFQDGNKVFQPKLYRQVLAQANLEPLLYEQMIKQRMLLGRLEQIIAGGSSWVPPSTLAMRTQSYTDTFTLCTAVFSNTVTAADVEVTDEMVQNYYDHNPEQFTLKDQRQVVYTVFKAKDYLNQVTVPEDEILDYYDANMRDFQEKGTNGVSVTKPLEAVRTQIEDTLAEEASKLLAYRAAAEFSDVFYTNRNENLTFEAAAAAAGYAVVTSRLFTVEGSPVLADASPAFVEAAFMLEPENLLTRVSEAVNGGKESYVMGFLTNIPQHVRPFEQVKAAAHQATTREAMGTAFHAQVEKHAEQLQADLEAKKSFKEWATAAQMVLSTNFTYSVMDSYGDQVKVPAGRQIATAMARLDSGEVAKSPVGFANGVVFFEVVERKPGDSLMFNSVRQQLVQAMVTESLDVLWTTWLEDNLMAMKPVTRIPIDALPDSVEDEPGDVQ